MKSKIFILIIFTISSHMLFGCDQIMDRSLGNISKTKNNDSTLTNKESSLKSLDSSSEENITKKLEQKEGTVEEVLSNDNNNAFKKKYEVIGTNKDGPYRSGETNRIRSTK